MKFICPISLALCLILLLSFGACMNGGHKDFTADTPAPEESPTAPGADSGGTTPEGPIPAGPAEIVKTLSESIYTAKTPLTGIAGIFARTAELVRCHTSRDGIDPIVNTVPLHSLSLLCRNT